MWTIINLPMAFPNSPFLISDEHGGDASVLHENVLMDFLFRHIRIYLECDLVKEGIRSASDDM